MQLASVWPVGRRSSDIMQSIFRSAGDKKWNKISYVGLYAQTLENYVKLDFRLPQSDAALAC